MKNKKGFTLVELLVVIVLISLIMVLVVPQVQKVALQSKIKLCKSKVTLAEEALNLWVQDNYKCITTTDNCGMFSECSYNESSNEYTCKTTFSLLAKNNIVNYDKKIKDINYIINPINNGNMNDLIFNVRYNPDTKKVSTETNNKVETEICSSNSINEPIDTKESTTSTTTTTTTATTTNTTATQKTRYKLIINNQDGQFINKIGDNTYTSGETVTIPLDFNSNYELNNYTCQNCDCTKSDNYIKVIIKNSDAIVNINAKKKQICGSFANDSWSTIKENINKNNTDCYKVGHEKNVSINGTNYKVRIANKSTPPECNNSNFSQTACGFVVEFAYIVGIRAINSPSTNVGGWPATAIRIYANKTFYNKLPEELRNVIIDTKVVSGNGSRDWNTSRTDGNWESTDKIYLLSAHEVWEDGTRVPISKEDTAYDQTRQLDYYANLGVTTSNYTDTINKNNGSTSHWWLRTAVSGDDTSFFVVSNTGLWAINDSHYNIGFAPAFRIG